MRRKKLGTLFLALVLLICSPSLATAETHSLFLWKMGETGVWKEHWNALTHDPSFPCRGPTGEFQWSTRADGAYGIEITESTPCSTVAILPESYDWSHQPYEIEVQVETTSRQQDRNLLVRWQDEQNYLGFHFFGERVVAEKFIDGEAKHLSQPSSYFLLPEYQTVSFRVEYDPSAYRFRLWHEEKLILESFEARGEPQLQKGWFGVRASVGVISRSSFWLKHFRVSSLGAPHQLSVPHFRQTDPLWRDEIYDHAADWSDQPTLRRWGCALTSAVMVLRFYGIRSLPSGENLNPATLNRWLVSQSDGYLSQGALNWRALTRLSSWHTQQSGTPSLEFSYGSPAEKEKHSWLKDHLQAQRPIILAQPGHFIVAHGVGPGEADFSILDPFYPFFSLQEYQNTYLSARVFTPSFTDLSALQLHVPVGTLLQFQDNQGKILSVNPVEEFLPADPDDLTHTVNKKWWVYDLPKPPSSLTVLSPNTLIATPIEILRYAKEGQATQVKGIFSAGEKEVLLEYDQEKPTFLQLPDPVTRLERVHVVLWLSQFRIRSPFIIEHFWNWEKALSEVPSLEHGQTLLDSWKEQLHLWVQNDWMDWDRAQVLEGVLSAQLLERFP